MAKFKRNLWTKETPNDLDPPSSQDMLLVSVLIWLRTYSRNDPQWLGLESLIELLVPLGNKLTLGQGVPELPADMIVTSKGDVFNVPNVPAHARFVWCSNSAHRELDLNLYGYSHIKHRVHINWIEWALATASVMLYNSYIVWTDGLKKPPLTIGGFQTADFLDL